MTNGGNYPFEALYQFSRALHREGLDTRRIIQTTLVHAGEMIGVKQGCLITFQGDDSIQSAYILDADKAAEEASAELWETLLDRGLIGFVYHAHRTVVIHNIKTDPRWPELPDLPTMPKQGSVIGTPLYRGGDVFAVMLLMHSEINFFDPAKVKLLEEISELVAGAMNNALRYDTDKHTLTNYDALFQSAVVPIVLTDLDGQIIDLNQQAVDLLGYEREALLQHPITAINNIDAGPWEAEGLNSLEPEEPVFFCAAAKSAEGKEIPVILRIRRIQRDMNDVVEWVQQDITAQKELDQLRQDLSAMIYHDLRGPLASIRGSIYKLAQVLANHENPAVLTFLQLGIRSIRQLRRMIDSLLDVQRLEEGNKILNRNPIELRVVLADAIQLVQPLAIEADQRLKFDWDDKDMPMLNIDSDMILRVVTNLLENAIKHTPEGGTITLGAHKKGDHKVCVSVKDSGQGIPKDLQSQIFDKFVRLKYKNAPQGVGLGLAFCRLAVDAHGGEIWVESEPGNGSEFIFTLPLDLPTPDNAMTALATTAP